MTLPRLALSIRQPWAWAIVHAGKHLENRSWGGWGYDKTRQRGPICIHASGGMTRAEYEDARDFMAKHGVTCPPPADLVRGAVIGTVEEEERQKLAQIFALRRQAAEALSAAMKLEESMHERRRAAMTEARERLRHIAREATQLKLAAE